MSLSALSTISLRSSHVQERHTEEGPKGMSGSLLHRRVLHPGRLYAPKTEDGAGPSSLAPAPPAQKGIFSTETLFASPHGSAA